MTYPKLEKISHIPDIRRRARQIGREMTAGLGVVVLAASVASPVRAQQATNGQGGASAPVGNTSGNGTGGTASPETPNGTGGASAGNGGAETAQTRLNAKVQAGVNYLAGQIIHSISNPGNTKVSVVSGAAGGELAESTTTVATSRRFSSIGVGEYSFDITAPVSTNGKPDSNHTSQLTLAEGYVSPFTGPDLQPDTQIVFSEDPKTQDWTINATYPYGSHKNASGTTLQAAVSPIPGTHEAQLDGSEVDAAVGQAEKYLVYRAMHKLAVVLPRPPWHQTANTAIVG